jgi:hypothetical protein
VDPCVTFYNLLELKRMVVYKKIRDTGGGGEIEVNERLY